MFWKRLISVIFTLLVLVSATMAVWKLWVHYMDAPWTRDGRVRANIINIAPDVAGLITALHVTDNQEVKKGDLLMQIDPSHFQLAVKAAEAKVAARRATLDRRRHDADRRRDMDARVVSREDRDNALHAAKAAEAEYLEAVAELEQARLNLSRTEVRAPVDGYITNLNMFQGDFATRGEPALALVDKHSFYIYGYFEETRIPRIREGDRAEVRLMSGQILEGRVTGIARGIFDRDNPDSRELVADVNPTFNWVRLARRIPVRIELVSLPEGIILSAGLTCTVVVNSSVSELPFSPDRW